MRLTLYPSKNRQSQIRRTVSMGSTSAKRQINHFVVTTANGSPKRSKHWLICGARLFSSSFSTSMSIMRPVIVLVWYDDAISSTIIFSSQNVHSSSLVTIKIKPGKHHCNECPLLSSLDLHNFYLLCNWVPDSIQHLCYGAHRQSERWTVAVWCCRKKCYPERFVEDQFLSIRLEFEIWTQTQYIPIAESGCEKQKFTDISVELCFQ